MKLTDQVGVVPLIGPSYVTRLKNLEIKTVRDLLYHLPSRYVDFTHTAQIENLKIGEQVTIVGQVVSIQSIRTKRGKFVQIAKISDGNANIEAIWMNQPYIIQMLPIGTQISLSGKLSFWGKKRIFSFPQFEKLIEGRDTVHTGKLIPIYPETANVSSKWLRSRIIVALQSIESSELEDYLVKKTREDLSLIELQDAVNKIHQPKNDEDHILAKRRLAFDELLLLNIENNLERIKWRKNNKSPVIKISTNEAKKFIRSLPFKLTPSQNRTLTEVIEDLQNKFAMNRLLEGDVGSGKTVIAAAAAYASAINGYKSLIMAPTQILATQHYLTLTSILKPFGISCTKVLGGEKNTVDADVVVGTHALLNKNYDKVGLVVIDEQHRFGVNQRSKMAELSANEKHPHVLTMTATPIPRTIALTLYGDLELSTLDELPKGRKPVTTWLVPPSKREGSYGWIEEKIEKEKIQVFVVCPIIEDSENETMLEVKSAVEEHKRLQKVFINRKLGLLHGRMKNKEKEDVLTKFKNGKYDILVSTPVVEVGIDIPNASIMVIEAADRFGLAQLHQLRGRVGRGERKSYCLLLTESKSIKVTSRLKAMTEIKSGRELAEIDLKTRGPGEVFGLKQHGYGELKIADWSDIGLIKKTKSFADKIISNQVAYKSIFDYYRLKKSEY